MKPLDAVAQGSKQATWVCLDEKTWLNGARDYSYSAHIHLVTDQLSHHCTTVSAPLEVSSVISEREFRRLAKEISIVPDQKGILRFPNSLWGL